MRLRNVFLGLIVMIVWRGHSCPRTLRDRPGPAKRPGQHPALS
jgi:hypothetical protein